MGATRVNAVRVVTALFLHAATHRCIAGVWLPNVASANVIFLGASGVIGLALGDQALFTAFRLIGPRMTLLCTSMSPIVGVILGSLFLSERLVGPALLGIAASILGIVWVVAERVSESPGGARQRRKGVALALTAALCGATGFFLSKRGMGHGWSPSAEFVAPQTATLIRMAFATLAMIPIVLLREFRSASNKFPSDDANPQTTEVRASARTEMRTGAALAACGAVTGPFLGVWLSLVASDRVPLGIAQTLCSLSPVFILPFAAVLHQERIGVRAIGGACLAVAGIVTLFIFR